MLFDAPLDKERPTMRQVQWIMCTTSNIMSGKHLKLACDEPSWEGILPNFSQSPWEEQYRVVTQLNDVVYRAKQKNKTYMKVHLE
jgi:hypothetical protein